MDCVCTFGPGVHSIRCTRGIGGPGYCHLWSTLRFAGRAGIASRQGGVFHVGARQSRRVSSGRLCAPQGAGAAALGAHPRLFRWPDACGHCAAAAPCLPLWVLQHFLRLGALRVALLIHGRVT